MSAPRDTEVDAYIFIKENLKQLGWDTRSPSSLGRSIYTKRVPKPC